MDDSERGETSAELTRTITSLESFVPDPQHGLPEDVFQLVSRLTPLLSVDLLLQDDQARTLLTWRHDVAYGPGWHIPGGIVRYKELARDRIHAVAHLELGAEVACEPSPLLVTEHVRLRSQSRGHVVSLLYRCSLLTLPDEKLRFKAEAPTPGQWRWHARGTAKLIPEQQVYQRYLR